MGTRPRADSLADGDDAASMNDVWSRTLSRIPTQFGRLVYLASLRNANTGRYQHFGLSQIYGDAEANRALRISHERVFAKWLNFSLEEQKTEIESYIDSIEDDRGAVLEAWRSLSPYQNLPPAGAGDAERHLYSSDLEIILELLRSETSSADDAESAAAE